jgi:hypothetical protein
LSSVIHIVIDNNLPSSVAGAIAGYWTTTYPRWTVRNEKEIAKCSSPDSHWISKLSKIEKEGRWLIITNDRGANTSKVSEKLPRLCKQHRHAYVIVSQSLMKEATLKAAMASIWPRLPDVIIACDKLVHREKPHVRLAPTSSAATEFKLHIANKGLEEYFKK